MPDTPLPALTGSPSDRSHDKTYECDQCGLCCQHLIVEADWADVLREPRIADRCPNPATGETPPLEQCWILAPAPDADACPFLGEDHACAIHPTRPTACVTFAAGSPRCQQLRARAGLPPLAPAARPGPDITARLNAAIIDAERADPP